MLYHVLKKNRKKYLCDSSNERMFYRTFNIYNEIRNLTFTKLAKHAMDVHEKLPTGCFLTSLLSITSVLSNFSSLSIKQTMLQLF